MIFRKSVERQKSHIEKTLSEFVGTAAFLYGPMECANIPDGSLELYQTYKALVEEAMLRYDSSITNINILPTIGKVGEVEYSITLPNGTQLDHCKTKYNKAEKFQTLDGIDFDKLQNESIYFERE